MVALVLFCLLYLVFVLTLMPPVTTGNQDLLVYKAIRTALFAIVVLPILFFSDFAWCKRIPFFSSPRTSQRVLGVVLLTALLVLLSVNLAYLHTTEYRTAVAHRAALALGLEEAPASDVGEDAGATEDRAATGSEPAASSGETGGESLQSAWNERREGCGTDD